MSSDIQKIKERNKRVELDKAWEVSRTRRIIIAVFTYIIIAVFLFFIGAPNPWFNALVPALGFLLSMMTLPFFKKVWANKFYK
ncbi:MAG: hypothetical protein AABY16_04870 [Nanoarchaeota archaeon]